MNKELAANTTLSHYRIVSKLGEGGMGEVWRARETRNSDRMVALKIEQALSNYSKHESRSLA